MLLLSVKRGAFFEVPRGGQSVKLIIITKKHEKFESI